MALRGLALVLIAAAAALPLAACGGDDEPGQAAATATAAESSGATGTAPPYETDGQGTDTSAATDDAYAGGGGQAEDEGEPVSREEITEAAARTADAESARVSTDVAIEAPGLDLQTFGGEGVFDFGTRTGRVDLDLGGLQGSPFTEASVVYVDHDVYYGLPEGFLPGGERWLVIDLQNLVDSPALDFGQLFQGSQADPGQYLLWLDAIGPDVRRLGEESVRGAETTRYRATVDLDVLERQAPEGREGEWKAYVDAAKLRLGTTKVPVEIWVDGDGLVRRLRQAQTLGIGAAQVTSTVTMELWDFGVPVDVSRPPAGQVAQVSDLIRP